jgi:hypothetical protein
MTMRNNKLTTRPLNFSHADDQLRFPFTEMDEVRGEAALPLTSVHLTEVADRFGRRYELVVHQSPRTGAVLAYCLRPTRLH